MMYLIGLGIGERGISLEGLERAKECDILYLEAYTSILPDVKMLEGQLGKKIIPLSREEIEEKNVVLENANKNRVGLLVGGDPMCATTHTELFLEAKKRGIPVAVVHSSSIFSAVGASGLQPYKFGRAASIPYPEKNFFTESPYLALKDNLSLGLHTLLLLDIKAAEQRYMSANEGLEVMLELEKKRKENIFTKDTRAVVLARVGWKTQKIAYGTASSLLGGEFGAPPHALIVPGKLHFLEEEILKLWSE